MMASIVRRLSDDEHDDESHDEHEEQEAVLIVLGLALLAGLASSVLMRKSPVPYTVLLFMAGVALGEIDCWLKKYDTYADSEWHKSVRSWAHINPHLVLYVFLPTLIYESASNINSHVFAREVNQILWLAVFGVIICTILTASVIRIMPFGIDSWNACLMMGAMLSATDPVAVVALMKELGASIQLGTLIEGESLLNDGTSIVIFTCFKEALTGEEKRGPLEILGYFFQLSVGGVLIGYTMAVLLSVALSRIYNDSIGEITACFVCCYMTFYLAESVTTSGVLALVALGIYMSAKGRLHVEPSVQHVMHYFWEIQAHFANTIVFFISGIIVVERGINDDEHENGWSDIGWLLVLYLLLHVIRFGMLLLLRPFLVFLGYGFSWEQLVACCYGGLRGAIGLCLAMIVEEDTEIDETTRSKSIFLMSGIAMLTLLVNGTTMKPLLAFMGLTRIDDVRQEAFEEACDLIDQEVTLEMMEELEHNRFLSDVNNQTGLASVFQYMPVHTRFTYERRIKQVNLLTFNDEISPRLQKRWRRYNRTFGPKQDDRADEDIISHSSLFEQANPLNEDDERERAESMRSTVITPCSPKRPAGIDMTLPRTRQQFAWLRTRFIHALKTEVLVLVEDGFIDPMLSRILVEMADEQMDRDLANDELETFEFLKDMVQDQIAQLSSQSFTHCLNCRAVRPVLKKYVHDKLANMFEIMIGFVLSHEHALHNILSAAKVDPSLTLAEQYPILNQLQQEVYRNTRAFESFTEPFFRNFPDVMHSIKTKAAARILLAKEREKTESMHHQGIIDEREYAVLTEALNTSTIKLNFHPSSTKEMTKKQFITVQPFLSGIETKAVEALSRCASDHYYEPGKTILEEGTAATSWLLVGQGNVLCTSHNTPQEQFFCGANSVIGAIGVLTDTDRQCTVSAHSFVHGYTWTTEDTASLIAQHASLAVALWMTQAAAIMAATPAFDVMPTNDFTQLARSGRLVGSGALPAAKVTRRTSISAGVLTSLRSGAGNAGSGGGSNIKLRSSHWPSSDMDGSNAGDTEEDSELLVVKHPAILLNGEASVVNDAEGVWQRAFSLVEPKTYHVRHRPILLEVPALEEFLASEVAAARSIQNKRRTSALDATFMGIEHSRKMMGSVSTGGAVPAKHRVSSAITRTNPSQLPRLSFGRASEVSRASDALPPPSAPGFELTPRPSTTAGADTQEPSAYVPVAFPDDDRAA